jgi:hypothetical protein
VGNLQGPSLVQGKAGYGLREKHQVQYMRFLVSVYFAGSGLVGGEVYLLIVCRYSFARSTFMTPIDNYLCEDMVAFRYFRKPQLDLHEIPRDKI